MSFIRATGDIIGFLFLSVMAIVEAIVKSCIPRRYRMKSVAGEIALVTGGGSGLGRLLSLKLAELGAIVVIWDINKAGMDETIKLIRAAGGTCFSYVCNLCNKEDVYKKAEILKKDVGQVSILVNNAGIVNGKKLMEISDELITRTMDVNIMSHFWTAKAFLPAMMEKNEGHIVSVASLAGHVGVPKLTDYCASKAAVVGFDEALRMELADDGYTNIHTTVICPYFIRSTGMFDSVESRLILRFVSPLNSNEVADRIIMALRCNEKSVILPGYFQGLIAAKWFFPWTCFAMFIQGLVQDTGSESGSTEKLLNGNQQDYSVSKDQNGTIHQQLTRRISNSERKP